ncbi:uncharacterized protein M437DRAFT_70434 [Aureobasidium melanogenum CBS 110374]|uniref:Uncharacterized protein n=1 Tax=Aureobasidium melanogenum (strain CBS 110374) TaxID=1043003 RepID=A0A074VJV8_AURM1|nr:uncharacterized protein M437DRAFT_70434 [Aureobasidium melanogenum CBS 110374]KEQ57912.1 hypothetical protein M437DRAFT_70434 [Aureobasidium melanogenum CBS 110374]
MSTRPYTMTVNEGSDVRECGSVTGGLLKISETGSRAQKYLPFGNRSLTMLASIEPTAVAQDLDIFPELDFNRKIEILYYSDLRWMERVGRRDKTHVKLRSKFMERYGPDGDMSHGDLLLWVELGVLKAKDIEAEYIGCYEATGFLAYDHDPNFAVDG